MFTRIRIFLLLIYFMPHLLLADLLVLKNGQRITGYFVKEVRNGILFKTLRGKVKYIRNSKLREMKIGYTGTQMCLTEKEKNKPNCKSLFYKVKGNYAWIVEGEGFLKIRKVPLDQIKKIELQKSKRNSTQKPLSIPKGHVVEIKYAGKKIKGEVVSQNNKKIQIKTPDGKIKNISTRYIKNVVFKPNKTPSIPFRFLYPGVYQYENGAPITGTSLGVLFFSSLVGVAVEYQAAARVASQASNDPTVAFFNNNSYHSKFDYHQNMQAGFSVVAASLFFYNLWDYYYGTKENRKEANSTKSSFFLTLNIPKLYMERVNPTFNQSKAPRLLKKDKSLMFVITVSL